MLAHRSVLENGIPEICCFTQNEAELFYAFPKATYPLTPEQLNSAINVRFESTAFLLDGHLAGFVNYYQCVQGEKCAVGNVMVAPEMRRHGVGAYIINTMTEIAFVKYAVKEVEISCMNPNTRALLLYNKLGFIPFSMVERMDKHNERLVVIHMHKIRDTQNVAEQ